jgi:hypothetical protein
VRPPSSTGLFIGAEPNTIRSGHEDQFLPRRPNARYRFRLRTFAGTSANGRDAPIADIHLIAIEALGVYPIPPLGSHKSDDRFGAYSQKVGYQLRPGLPSFRPFG